MIVVLAYSRTMELTCHVRKAIAAISKKDYCDIKSFPDSPAWLFTSFSSNCKSSNHEMESQLKRRYYLRYTRKYCLPENRREN
uniref:Uncharacterized protein n=1 Tax=Glossina brevipalpis TaxID=37001 RepID=A0A1A9W7Z5_9MUSC